LLKRIDAVREPRWTFPVSDRKVVINVSKQFKRQSLTHAVADNADCF
jgi:hypothetical protein